MISMEKQKLSVQIVGSQILCSQDIQSHQHRIIGKVYSNLNLKNERHQSFPELFSIPWDQLVLIYILA